MIREILEGINWQTVKSTVPGSNKGVKILLFKDGKDFIEIAKQSDNDEYSVAAYWNDDKSDLIEYEQDVARLTSKEYYSQLKKDFPNLPKLTKKMLTGLDVLKDETDDWGSVR